MLFDLTRYSPADFKHEIRQLLALAIPMMLGQIATVAIGVVDTAMSGAAGKDDLTAVALGSSVFSTLFITFMGIMAALNPIIAQQHGAGGTHEVGETGRQGVWFGLLLGILGMAVLFALIIPLQNYLDMSAHIKTMFARYLGIVALGLPAALIYRALHAYASSLNKPQPIMWINWAALLLNIPLNYLFIFGAAGTADLAERFQAAPALIAWLRQLPVPTLGGVGAGVATTIVFWFGTFALALYLAKSRDLRRFGFTQRFSRPNWRTQKNIATLGWAIGLSYFLEASLFTFIVWLIADLGENHVAAQQIVLSLSSVIYMIPQAIGSAATVRIGYAIGRKQFARARYISGVAIVCGWILGACTLVALLVFRLPLAKIYTQDAAVLALAASLIVFAGVFQVFDFTQCIASYALRGYKITRVPMIIHAVAFWCLGLVLGYILAHAAHMGIYGFWTALIISLASAATALVWYLEQRSRLAKHDRKA